MVQKTHSLRGRTVAITRPAGQAEEASRLIYELGGVPYLIPALEIRGLSNYNPIKKFIAELGGGHVDYVVLMSTNGVKYLFEAAEVLKQVDELQDGLTKTFVIGVGPRTSETLKRYNVHVDIVPNKYSSEGLIEYFQKQRVSGKKIRIPRTSNATPTLTDKLKEMGADVQEIYVYESGLPTDEKLKVRFYEDLINGKIDAIVFGSGLSVKNIFRMLSEQVPIETLRDIINSKVTTVAIGPTTAEALRELALKVDVMPQDYLFEKALVALAVYWSAR